MASLIPLLHDLLPIFMPSEVQIARGGELLAVEERAERPPWYRRQDPRMTTSECHGADAEDGAEGTTPSGKFEPIQLLDHEEGCLDDLGAIPGERRPTAGPSDAGEYGSRSSTHYRGGPRVFRKNAVVGFSDKMCVTVLTVQPQSATAIHHNGEQDVIIYATTPGILLTSRPLDTVKAIRADMKGEEPSSEEEEPRRLELQGGDFALIPAWSEHQVVNEAVDKDVSWVVFRYGAEPIQVDLDGWGGRRIKA
ncbi:unnamed protein product [Discula destructiva]